MTVGPLLTSAKLVAKTARQGSRVRTILLAVNDAIKDKRKWAAVGYRPRRRALRRTAQTTFRKSKRNDRNAAAKLLPVPARKLESAVVGATAMTA